MRKTPTSATTQKPKMPQNVTDELTKQLKRSSSHKAPALKPKPKPKESQGLKDYSSRTIASFQVSFD